MSIGKRLRFFRKKAQMTQKELGLLAGFSPLSAEVRIAQYESGERTPRYLLREKLASALGVASAALSVPNIENDRELMHLLFALEDHCRMTITENDYAFRLEIPNQEFTLQSIAHGTCQGRYHKPQRNPRFEKQRFLLSKAVFQCVLCRGAIAGTL